jgi:hypothetical protein
LYIVTKMGSHPRPPRDLSNVYGYLLSPKTRLFPADDTPRERDPASYYQHEDEYLAFHNRILALEPQILYALSFDTHVSLPHPLAVTYLQTLDFLGQPKEVIGRKTIEYLNTALLSPQMLYLTHQPHSLATAAIYNAAKDLGSKTPESAWWEVFDVDREELGFLVVGMRSLETWAKAQRGDNPALFGEHMVTRKLAVALLRLMEVSARLGMRKTSSCGSWTDGRTTPRMGLSASGHQTARRLLSRWTRIVRGTNRRIPSRLLSYARCALEACSRVGFVPAYRLAQRNIASGSKTDSRRKPLGLMVGLTLELEDLGAQIRDTCRTGRGRPGDRSERSWDYA